MKTQLDARGSSFSLGTDGNVDARSTQLTLTPPEARALNFLLPLSREYPDIDGWFFNKVVPGLRIGTRILLSVERDGRLVGLGIGKNEDSERKICTVRIASTYVGRGIGMRIFDSLLHWLDDDQPHLTVNATKLPVFERIFDYYGFRATSSRSGVYLPDETEVGFNERNELLQISRSTEPLSHEGQQPLYLG